MRQCFIFVPDVSVLQSAQFVVGNAVVVVDHQWREQGRYAVGWCQLYVACVEEHLEAQMIEAATGSANAAAINAHLFVGFLSIRHLYAFHALIVADNLAPVWPYLGCAIVASLQPASVPGGTAVAVLIVGPWQAGGVLCSGGCELNAGSQ